MSPCEHASFDFRTELVLGAVCKVSNTLGAGLPEEVYEHALLRELRRRGLKATCQAPVAASGVDIFVDDALVVELKREQRLACELGAQCPNYQRVSGRTMCLVAQICHEALSFSVFEDLAV